MSRRLSPSVYLRIAALFGLVCAADGQTNTATNLTTMTFSNSTPISIIGLQNPVPYPSTIQVPIGGTITKVTVTLYGLTHPSPSDIQGIMIAGPPSNGSQAAIELMSSAGDEAPITNVNLTFDDAATNQLPSDSQIFSGTYQVSVYLLGDYYASTTNGPAPAYNTTNDTLSDFIGTPMLGTWGLYISDFGPNNGSINGGWALTISYTGGTNPPPMGLAVSSPVALTNGQLQFTVTGTPGAAFSIQDSSDLKDWGMLASETMPASGSFTFTTATVSSRYLFYRAVATQGTPAATPMLSAPRVFAQPAIPTRAARPAKTGLLDEAH